MRSKGWKHSTPNAKRFASEILEGIKISNPFMLFNRLLDFFDFIII
jgi:hypothetical protein